MPNKAGQLTKRERIIINLLKIDTPRNRHERRAVAKAVQSATRYCLKSDKTAKVPGSAYARIAAALLPHVAIDESKKKDLERADKMLRAMAPITDAELKAMLDPNARVEESKVDAVGVLPTLRPDSAQERGEQDSGEETLSGQGVEDDRSMYFGGDL